MAPRDEPQTVHEVGESSHQAELRAQLQQVNLMGTDAQTWKATIEERLSRTWRQALVAACWQQVAVWRERLQGWIWMLGTLSTEARLLCLAIVLATIAIILACLPYFLR
ncbi:hypothetical protein E3N88_08986 [Mikania micrantha]|uniref:Uncharacterized protein n=1 Tax=Mikania micrantha TaxID=192012 RepID=A0A5N6PHS3_9ASTR|nr:hypothetical protein E3N88_08986 [Mikania micrantha]